MKPASKHTFSDRPISQKLAIITMATTASALLLAGLGILVVDSVLFRGLLKRDLSGLAHIVAENSTAPLLFGDPDSAAQTLRALRARSHVDAACLYQPDGTVFARYSRFPDYTCPTAQDGDVIQSGEGGLTLWQPVTVENRRVGTLMMLYNLGELTERVRLYGAIVTAILLSVSLVALLLSWRLRAIVADPISQLVNATMSVSETGDYGIRAQRLSGDELGVLADRFNEMLAGIQSRDQDLRKALIDREEALLQVREQRQRFEFMAESMPQKIFTAGPQGDSTYLNRLWMDFTGLTFEQLKGWGWTQMIHPEDVEEGTRIWKEHMATGEPFQLTSRLRRADGLYRWHLSRARAMRNPAGEIVMWVGSSTDIHEQKQREEELRRANDDLQQFAYSASHDLQEPIRNVAIYSELVANRYHDRLDDDGLMYLGFLKEGGRRLATLVNDLLAYTRASRAELSAAASDAAVALQNALDSLSESVRENEARITYNPLPEVHMGEAHLQQVFQNLIGNALKYRREPHPEIHISAESRGAFWLFSVRDNGIGIDPQHKEKIFGVFKRLHHDQKYSGTGIGLAICQRVVERYGGRIWVESEPGRGSVFYFTIPLEATTAVRGTAV